MVFELKGVLIMLYYSSYTGAFEPYRVRLEYVLYKTIMDYNQEHASDASQQLFLSDARRIENQMVENFRELYFDNNRQMDQITFENFLHENVNSLFPERVLDYYDKQGGIDRALSSAVSECHAVTGLKYDMERQPRDNAPYKRLSSRDDTFASEACRTMNSYGVNFDGYVYPISPFDSRFADLDVVQRYGTQMLCIRSSDVDNLDASEISSIAQYVICQDVDPNATGNNAVRYLSGMRSASAAEAFDANGECPGEKLPVSTFSFRNGNVNTREIVDAQNRTVNLVNTADKCGISQLRKRMNNGTNYEELRDKLVEYIDSKDFLYKDFARMRNDVEVSIEMIDALNEAGLAGHIERESRDGQLKYVLSENGRSIRIFDTEDNGTYMGRIYANGANIYLYSDENAVRNPEYDAHNAPYMNPYIMSRKEGLDMVDAVEAGSLNKESLEAVEIPYAWRDIYNNTFNEERSKYYETHPDTPGKGTVFDMTIDNVEHQIDGVYNPFGISTATRGKVYVPKKSAPYTLGENPHQFMSALNNQFQSMFMAGQDALERRKQDMVAFALMENGIDVSQTSLVDDSDLSFDSKNRSEFQIQDSVTNLDNSYLVALRPHGRAVPKITIKTPKTGGKSSVYDRFKDDPQVLAVKHELKSKKVPEAMKLEFDDKIKPNTFIQNAVRQARENVKTTVGVDIEEVVFDEEHNGIVISHPGGLLTSAADYLDTKVQTGDSVRPKFDSLGEISTMQREYFDVLTGRKNSLINPKSMLVDDASLDEVGDEIVEDIVIDTARDEIASSMEILDYAQLNEQYDELSDEYKELFETMANQLTIVDSMEVAEGRARAVEENRTYNREARSFTPQDIYGRYELVERHMNSYLDNIVGSYEPNEVDGLRFSISKVAHNMVGSLVENQNNLVAAIRRTNKPETVSKEEAVPIPFDELRVNGRQDEQLATRTLLFDEEGARKMLDIIADAPNDEVAANYDRILGKITSTLELAGCRIDPEDVLMDEAGRIHYTFERPGKRDNRNGNWRQYDAKTGEFTSSVPYNKVEAEIGPIYIPREDGYVHVHPELGRNYVYAPGYSANLIPTDKMSGSIDERIRLLDYMTQLEIAIGNQITDDLSLTKYEISGSPNSLLRFYSQNSANAKRRDVNFEQTYMDYGLPIEGVASIKGSEVNTVNYNRDLELHNASTTLTAIQNNPEKFSKRSLLANDNAGTSFGLTKQHNMSIIDSDVFSTELTPNARGQGTKVHIIPGVKIVRDEDSVVPSYKFDLSDLPDKVEGRVGNYSAIEEYRTSVLFGGVDYSGFDQWNRAQMAANNLQDMITHTQPVNVCQTTLGGWNQDDAFVVSKKFAEEHEILGGYHDDEGNVVRERRALGVGDKLSDAHGNKGVISLVVDPDWTFEEAQERGCVVPWSVFNANPDLDVALSPFSEISRNNGGTAREIMGNGTSDLNIPVLDGNGGVEFDENGKIKYETQAGSMGKLSIIIHDKAADKESLVYTDTMVKSGRNRSFGWQPTTALIGAGCESILSELYSNGGDAPLANLKEHLRVCGMDFDMVTEDVFARDGITKIDEVKKLNMKMGVNIDENTAILNLDIPDEFDEDGNLVNHLEPGVMPPTSSWGFVTSEDYKPYITDTGKLSTTACVNELSRNIMRHGGVLRVPFPMNFPGFTDIENGESVPHGGQSIPFSGVRDEARDLDLYDMPVMSAKLRNGVRYDDGVVTSHEYTCEYDRIVTKLVEWYRTYDEIHEMDMQGEPKGGSDKDIKNWNEKYTRKQQDLTSYENAIKNAFTRISEKVKSQNLSGNHNDFKSSLLSADIQHGATSVWSPNASLNINEVGMNKSTQQKLGVKEGQYVLLWRDPVLEDNNVRYVKVVTDNEVQGVSVHPGMATPIAGDFDGDKVGIARLDTKAAQKEAFWKLSFEANLLDTVHGQTEIGQDENGEPIMGYPLNYGTGLDMQVGRAMNPELDKQYKELVLKINQAEKAFADSIGQPMTYKPDPVSNSIPFEFVQQRQDLCDELSANLKATLNSAGSIKALSFEDDLAHLKSIQDVCVTTEAKGSNKKLFGEKSGVPTTGTYAYYFGDIVNFDEDGNILSVETNVDENGNPRSFRTKGDDMSCMLAMNAKTGCTSMPGKVMQYRAAVCKDADTMQIANAISQQGYQKVLDWKSNGKQAEEEAELLINAVKDLNSGININLMKDDSGKMIYKRASKDDRELTKDKYVDTFVELYDVLDLSCEKEAFERFADEIKDPDGIIPGIENTNTLAMERNPLAAMAFGEDFKTVVYAAEQGRDLFEGPYGEQVAQQYIKKIHESDLDFEMSDITAESTKTKYVDTQNVKSKDALDVSKFKDKDYIVYEDEAEEVPREVVDESLVPTKVDDKTETISLT